MYDPRRSGKSSAQTTSLDRSSDDDGKQMLPLAQVRITLLSFRAVYSESRPARPVAIPVPRRQHPTRTRGQKFIRPSDACVAQMHTSAVRFRHLASAVCLLGIDGPRVSLDCEYTRRWRSIGPLSPLTASSGPSNKLLQACCDGRHPHEQCPD
jgi:hypothetical protein